jgi:nucleoside 2-deoxyribosyltransferase
MRIYLAHQITGLSYDVVRDYYGKLSERMYELGLEVLCPMTAKGTLRTEIEFKSEGYGTPVSCNHAIFERDQWMVRNCDIILADLTGMERASIGCCMEMAWASLLGKHSIVVMEKSNPHRHAFVLESADIVFETLDEAIDYLKLLVNESIE